MNDVLKLENYLKNNGYDIISSFKSPSSIIFKYNKKQFIKFNKNLKNIPLNKFKLRNGYCSNIQEKSIVSHKNYEFIKNVYNYISNFNYLILGAAFCNTYIDIESLDKYAYLKLDTGNEIYYLSNINEFPERFVFNKKGIVNFNIIRIEENNYKEIIENIFFSEFKRYNEKATLEDFKLELIKNY
jgi:hypothetical protein